MKKQRQLLTLKKVKNKLKPKIFTSLGNSIDFDTQYRLDSEDNRLIYKNALGYV